MAEQKPTISVMAPKPDQLKHFQKHCAVVKLLALLLLTVRDIGVAAAAGGVPTYLILHATGHA